MNLKNLNNFLVNKRVTIRKTMRQIDGNGQGIAFVLNEDKSLLGIVTDGDIRRAIIDGASLDEKIARITNKKAITLRKKQLANYYKLIPQDKIPAYSFQNSFKVPIINSSGQAIDLFFIFKHKGKIHYELFSQLKKPLKERLLVKKILVIGGAGYLGSVLCRKLLKKDYKVKVLDNLTYGDQGIKNLYNNANFELIKGDICSINNVVNSVKNVEAVIHLAALVGDPASSISPQKTLATNYHSTKMIVEIAKYYQINRFIFSSTCSVYGNNSSAKIDLKEESKLKPVSLYARTKIQSEQAIFEEVDDNFSPTIFRLATLYGLSPRMRFDLVINLLIAKAMIEREITIFGGSQWRPFLHVQDAADAFIKCIQAPINKIKGEVFNVGSKKLNCQLVQIGGKINKLIPGAEMKILSKKVDKRDYKVNFTKINKILGFKTKHSIEDGVFEIKKLLEKNKVKDLYSPQYHNYKFLNNFLKREKL